VTPSLSCAMTLLRRARCPQRASDVDATSDRAHRGKASSAQPARRSRRARALTPRPPARFVPARRGRSGLGVNGAGAAGPDRQPPYGRGATAAGPRFSRACPTVRRRGGHDARPAAVGSAGAPRAAAGGGRPVLTGDPVRRRLNWRERAADPQRVRKVSATPTGAAGCD